MLLILYYIMFCCMLENKRSEFVLHFLIATMLQTTILIIGVVTLNLLMKQFSCSIFLYLYSSVLDSFNCNNKELYLFILNKYRIQWSDT
jgi:hypothetical protein